MVGAGAVYKGDAAVFHPQVNRVQAGVNVIFGVFTQINALLDLRVAVAQHRRAARAAVVGGQPQHRGQRQNYSDKQQIFSFLGHGSLSNSSSSVRPSYPATAAGYAVRAAASPGAGSVTAAL